MSQSLPANLRQTHLYEQYQIDQVYQEDVLAVSVFSGKYQAPEDLWNNKANLARFWERLAWAGAAQEKDPDKWFHTFFGLLQDFGLVPGGRINYALGRSGILASLMNCYVNPIKNDSLYGIYTYLAEAGRTYAKGGGVGTDITILRPHGAPVRGASIGAPGAVSFMDLLSMNTATIAQDGRRGALMISIRCWHPDVFLFALAKNDGWTQAIEKLAEMDPVNAKRFNDTYGDRRKISFANVSIFFTDDFMQAVRDDLDYEYRFPDITNAPKETDSKYLQRYVEQQKAYMVAFDGYTLGSPELETDALVRAERATVYDTRWDGDLDAWIKQGFPIKTYLRQKARILWNMVTESARHSGEPGIMFEDAFKRGWTATDPMLTTNPCGEKSLAAYEPCCLAHHNLTKFVTVDGQFLYDEFESACMTAVRFMDLIHDIDGPNQALQAQRVVSQKYRRLGIGVTGVADLLIWMRLRYGSPEAIAALDKIMHLKNDREYRASALLAKEKGACPGFNLEVFKRADVWQTLEPETQALIEQYGVRNIATSTVAPVGSGSILTQTGSGMEPLFRFEFERRRKRDDGSYEVYTVREKVIRDLFGNTAYHKMPDYVVDSTMISGRERIAMQAVMQKYTTDAISSTINLPRDVSVEEVRNLYFMAWEAGLKGVTVYREGSRAGILRSNDEDQPEEGRILPTRPRELPGKTFKLTADGRVWYVNVTLNKGLPYEVFINSNSPKEPAVGIDEAVARLANLALTHGVPQDIVAKQLKKSSHQSNPAKLGRIISLCLRHGVQTDAIIGILMALPNYNVTSVVFHIAKALSSLVPDGTPHKGACPACNGNKVIYQNGCAVCSDCGHSKCG